MENFETIGVFPVGLGRSYLTPGINQQELDYFYSLEMVDNKGNSKSQNSFVLNDTFLDRIYYFCRKGCQDYLKNIICATDVEVYITQSWINITKNNQYHHRHIHSNSFLSGVFYIKTDSNDTINFTNPHKPFGNFYFDVTSHNHFNSSGWFLPATTNSLIVFPSTLEHEVRTKTSDGDRISLSFNTFIKGSLGNIDQLTELTLK